MFRGQSCNILFNSSHYRGYGNEIFQHLLTPLPPLLLPVHGERDAGRPLLGELVRRRLIPY